jgi:hypothetical protein
MPFDDWQFWLVTLAAMWGVYALVRPFLPWRRRGSNGGRPPAMVKRSDLTVRGKKL